MPQSFWRNDPWSLAIFAKRAGPLGEPTLPSLWLPYLVGPSRRDGPPSDGVARLENGPFEQGLLADKASNIFDRDAGNFA